MLASKDDGEVEIRKKLFNFLINFNSPFLDYIDDGDFDGTQPNQHPNQNQMQTSPPKKSPQLKKEEDMNSSFENECAIY